MKEVLLVQRFENSWWNFLDVVCYLLFQIELKTGGHQQLRGSSFFAKYIVLNWTVNFLLYRNFKLHYRVCKSPYWTLSQVSIPQSKT